MEEILEIYEHGKNVKRRQLDRAAHEAEDKVAGKVGNIMKNDRQKFSKMSGSHQVVNEINKAKNIQYTKVSRNKDKKDYALVEKVIDKKTEAQFFRWQDSKFIDSVQGCISAGKEANVYYAPAGEASEEKGDFAIKIYKVETMVFRDREDYILGEFRFRKGSVFSVELNLIFVGHCRTNPRKLIKLWAEKEFRNLKRMLEVGLPVPTPIKIKDHVLVMDFIGEGSVAAPRKKSIYFQQILTNLRSERRKNDQR